MPKALLTRVIALAAPAPAEVPLLPTSMGLEDQGGGGPEPGFTTERRIGSSR